MKPVTNTLLYAPPINRVPYFHIALIVKLRSVWLRREHQWTIVLRGCTQRRQSGLKSEGSWIRVKNDFPRQTDKKFRISWEKFRFSRQIDEKFRFLQANWRKISIFQANWRKISIFQAKISEGPFLVSYSKMSVYSDKICHLYLNSWQIILGPISLEKSPSSNILPVHYKI